MKKIIIIALTVLLCSCQSMHRTKDYIEGSCVNNQGVKCMTGLKVNRLVKEGGLPGEVDEDGIDSFYEIKRGKNFVYIKDIDGTYIDVRKAYDED